MLSLYEKNEDQIIIDGVTHAIDASFDNILYLIDLSQEQSLPTLSKISLGMKRFFGNDSVLLQLEITEQLEIFRTVFKSYLEEKEIKTPVQKDLQGNVLPDYDEEDEDGKPRYSLKYDADYIYASFVQAYGIDLLEVQGKLHWFKFKALLNALPEDTKFREVMAIRTWKKSSHDSEKYISEMKKLQAIYALPDEENEVTNG